MPIGRLLKGPARAHEQGFFEVARDELKGDGVPASVKPAGSVMVGLPVMSNGQVWRSMPLINSASSPKCAIHSSVGEATLVTGTISRSTPSNSARTRPA